MSCCCCGWMTRRLQPDKEEARRAEFAWLEVRENHICNNDCSFGCGRVVCLGSWTAFSDSWCSEGCWRSEEALGDVLAGLRLETLAVVCDNGASRVGGRSPNGKGLNSGAELRQSLSGSAIGGRFYGIDFVTSRPCLCSLNKFVVLIFSAEKCVWHTLDDELVEINFRKRASARLSDMLRRARRGYAERGIRPQWMGENVFKEMLAYWKSDEFKKKSEKAKQRRASERGAANHRAGSISIADHAERMVVAKRRTPLMQELHERTYRGRDGEYCDDRARDSQPPL